MMTSASRTASSTTDVTLTPSRSMPGGTSVGGPHTHTSAPSRVSSRTFERSTRLCSRSPRIATFSPASRPLCLRIVNASSRACVGCSCIPSPALMIFDRHTRDSRWHAPDEAWRRTIMSGDIASRLSAVSTSVSPLTTLEVAMATLRVSALSRFSATSNDVRVRVLGSKKRFTTVRPRSVGTFLIGRCAISCIASAVSRMSTISSGVRSAMPSRCRCCRRVAGGASATATGSLLVGLDDDFVMTVHLLKPDLNAFAARRRHVLTHVVGLDRQLAVSPVDEHDELDGTRTPEVDQRVERGADRPPCIEHVIHQHDHAVVDVEQDVGAAHERLRADGLPHQIVAVERDVERAVWDGLAGDPLELGRNAARQRHAALADADDREVVHTAIALDDLVRDAHERARHAIGIHDYRHKDSRSAKCEMRSAKWK